MRQLNDGDMIVGYRFIADIETERVIDVVRNGAGNTLVVDRMAIAGPVFCLRLYPDKQEYMAVCRGCRHMSLTGRSDSLRRWAHRHRCDPGTRYEEHVQL